MITYVDSSVLLRIAFGQADRLVSWSEIEQPISSELIRVECLRTIDRARLRHGLAASQVAERRALVLAALDGFRLIPVDHPVLERASDPFPTLIGSLDAIHLSSAIQARTELPGLVFATHDEELGMAARAMGFDVHGLADH